MSNIQTPLTNVYLQTKNDFILQAQNTTLLREKSQPLKLALTTPPRLHLIHYFYMLLKLNTHGNSKYKSN